MTEKSHISGEAPGGLDESFREAMNNVPAMIWVSGEDKLCGWTNKSWRAFTGRTMDEERGHGWAEGVHPDDRGRCAEIYTTHFDAKQPLRMRYRLQRHDGIYRWIDHIGAPRYAGDGRLLGYISSCTDIHEQVEAETELRSRNAYLEQRVGEISTQVESEVAARHRSEQGLLESSAQLEVLIQGIKDYAIYMLDPQGHIISWNSGAERIKGYSADEILGRHFSCFYTKDDRKAGIPARALHVARSEGRFAAEGWRVRKDGSRFWASVVIDPIHDKSGAIIGFGKVTRDVTERRLAEEQLDRARESVLQMQKMEAIGQLTGGVAHDFNNLLMVIIGNLEMADRHADPDEASAARRKRAIGNAMQGARRGATLTQRLLAFARRQPLSPKPLELNKFIASEVEFLQRTLGENVEVQAVGGAGLWKVEVDLNQLEAALLNLAVNARDAMAEGGKLTIETSNAYLDEDYCRVNPEVQRGQYVLLSVTDNGAGMTGEVLGRAFEPFFSTKTVGHGTGLGLSQVYGFIKQSGGHVKLYSEPGEGTTVRIYLPRSDTTEDSYPLEEARPPVKGDPAETILIVEDDEDVRAYLVELLQDLNYRVRPAHDAASALEILEKLDIRVDLLLTDVILPGMNGRQLATKAQSVRPGLKVLYMTGYSRNAVVHQGRLDRDVELIQKPVTQDQLASRIRALLDK